MYFHLYNSINLLLEHLYALLDLYFDIILRQNMTKIIICTLRGKLGTANDP